MALKQTYAVFGLGKYGTAVAKELVANGADVIAVDADETIVNDLTSDLPICKCADVTDPEALLQIGIRSVEVAVIAMATNLESTVMCIMLCKEFGVQNIIAKCGNEMHRKILEKLGVNQIVFPEYDSGTRLAKNLLSSGFIDVIELAKNVSMVKIDVKPEWVGKSILELNLRKKYSLNIVAIYDKGTINTSVEPELILHKSMSLIVIANASKLGKLK
ncbi:MAG: TrkA family potassium uptake protein [Lachnospiraceae bacterium]|nr:TrkA family potassium uptake protein [Lachnospiraceae bacterium]